MTIVTALQIVWVFILYTLAIFLLPTLFFWKKLQVMRLTERVMFCLIVGNFWIITITLAESVLHIATPFRLFMGTYGIGFIAYCVRNHSRVWAALKRQGLVMKWLVTGELRGALYIKDRFARLIDKVRRAVLALCSFLRSHLSEFILLSLCLAGAVWFFSWQTLHLYGYGTSDMPVHVKWINQMSEGNVYCSGVYPYGWHAVMYYIQALTGIETLYLIRVMGTVQSLWIFLTLWVFLRAMCRSPYAAISGFAFLCLTSAFMYNAISRYQFALPQEYGMLFLFPMAYFLMKFYRIYITKTREEEQSERAIARERRRQPFLSRVRSFFGRSSGERSTTLPLLLFAASVSLTFSVHFYVTFAAFGLCAAITLTHLKALTRRGCLRRLICYVLLFMVIACIPMVYAFATGTKLEASLTWGMSVVSAGAGPSDYVTNSAYAELVYPYSFGDPEFSWLDWAAAILKAVSYYLRYAVSSGQWFYITTFAILFTLVYSVLHMVFRHKDLYGARWLSIFLYIAYLIMIVKYPSLGFPALMEGSRDSIFLAQVMTMTLACPFDALYSLLAHWKPTRGKAMSISCILCALTLAASRLPAPHITLADGSMTLTPRRNLSTSYALQYGGNVEVLYDLFSKYEDNTWTLVSSVSESNLVYGHGRHQDLMTLIRDLEDWEEGDELFLPTEYVFILVEKRPLEYASLMYLPKEKLPASELSDEDALIHIPHNAGNSLYTHYRSILMSKAVHWVEKLEALYPGACIRYFEDDDVICIRLQQNPQELLNLSVDYGFNTAWHELEAAQTEDTTTDEAAQTAETSADEAVQADDEAAQTEDTTTGEEVQGE